MTKLQNFAEATGLEMIGTSSVWNYHATDFNALGYVKSSNVYKELLDLKRQGVKGMVTIVVGCIGRSQHSKTEIGIFKGVVKTDDLYLWGAGHGEVKLELL